MSFKVRKIDLPDEIRIEKEGVVFTLSSPDHLDRAALLDSAARGEGLFSGMYRLLAKKLVKLEGAKYEDDTPVLLKDALRLPVDLLQEVFIEYTDKFNDYFIQEAAPKKELEPSESPVS